LLNMQKMRGHLSSESHTIGGSARYLWFKTLAR
jgi:hypothetical protein